LHIYNQAPSYSYNIVPQEILAFFEFIALRRISAAIPGRSISDEEVAETLRFEFRDKR
jgi:hypothetical protein